MYAPLGFLLNRKTVSGDRRWPAGQLVASKLAGRLAGQLAANVRGVARCCHPWLSCQRKQKSKQIKTKKTILDPNFDTQGWVVVFADYEIHTPKAV